MLELYVKQNGHCSIAVDDQILGYFARDTRREYKRYQTDPETSSLTTERIEQLNELGFVFDPHKHEWDAKMVSLSLDLIHILILRMILNAYSD